MKLFTQFLLLAVTMAAPAVAGAATLDEANRAFAEGRYHDSTLDYQAIVAEKGYSAPVLFDLGNSLYREGNVAQAILAYKQAQWLAPSDPDIAANLQLVQKQAGLIAAPSTSPEKFGRKLSTSAWAWLACGAWTLFCLSILARHLVPKFQASFAVTGGASAMLLAIAIAGAIYSSRELGEAVVTGKDAVALISPFPAAQKVFAPTPGETMKIEKAYEGYLLVSDAAGHTGWMSQAQLTPVVPSS